MDVTEIERLIELMRRAGIMHLALEQPEYRVSITRGAETQDAAPVPQAESLPPSAGAPPPAASGGLPVGSPVVGVVRAAGGGLPRVGDRVSRGQLLAVVEAMKVPNEVHSPTEGRLASVLVEDGSPVEYGQTLFVLRPDEGGGTDEDETLVGVA